MFFGSVFCLRIIFVIFSLIIIVVAFKFSVIICGIIDVFIIRRFFNSCTRFSSLITDISS